MKLEIKVKLRFWGDLRDYHSAVLITEEDIKELAEEKAGKGGDPLFVEAYEILLKKQDTE